MCLASSVRIAYFLLRNVRLCCVNVPSVSPIVNVPSVSPMYFLANINLRLQ